MQPLGQASASSREIQSRTDAPSAADRELLIDIDFFDAQGRWNPRHIVFCAAEDGARAKSLWTRCFRGLMALHGKLWAKNYLNSHFQKRSESTQLVQQIKQSGYVDKKMFQSTVAQCTLLYEDLEQVRNGKAVTPHSIIHSSPIEDIDKVVVQHFLQTDWEQWRTETQLNQITLNMADNITKIMKNLQPSTANDQVAKKFRNCLDFFDQYLEKNPLKQGSHKNMIDRFFAVEEDLWHTKRMEIITIMYGAVDDYIRRSEDEKIFRQLNRLNDPSGEPHQ